MPRHVSYFRQAVDVLIQSVLHTEYVNCDVACMFVRGILVQNVVQPMFDWLCDPFLLIFTSSTMVSAEYPSTTPTRREPTQLLIALKATAHTRLTESRMLFPMLLTEPYWMPKAGEVPLQVREENLYLNCVYNPTFLTSG